MTKTKKFIVIDANSLIHRAYHALPPLTTKDGQLVNAVYGFANIFFKVIREHEPDYLAVCFDVSGGTFRDEIYKDYKAGREEKPQEFHDQFDLIKELLQAMNVAVFELKGYEADDLIGTLTNSKKLKTKEKIKKIILTGDMDMLQLVDENTEVERAKKGISETLIYTPSFVLSEYGFDPEHVVDFKALKGDPSDNIPGVPGVGDKTATKLIQDFGSLENLYKHIDQVKHKKEDALIKESLLDKLFDYKKEAQMSKKLATIKRDVPIEFKLEDLAIKMYDTDAVVSLIQKLGFKSLLKRLPKQEVPSLFSKHDTSNNSDLVFTKSTNTKKSKLDYQLIDNEHDFDIFLGKLKKQKVFAIDTETNQLEAVGAQLIGMSFSWESGVGYYIPHTQSFLKKLQPILENAKIEKTGHNIKYDYQIFKQNGITLNGIVFDSMIASYLINPGSRSHSLNVLAFSEFGHQMIPIEDLIGKGKDQKSMADVPVVKVAEYAAEDADISWRLFKRFCNDENMKAVSYVFNKIEIPLIPILADMELEGITLDVKLLSALSKKLGERIKVIEKKVYELAGKNFNIASPKQLKDILFVKLKISTTGLSKTKTGVSTSAQDLEKLKGTHKIIDYIIEFRELSKLKNTYTDALPKLVNPTTGRVHTSFNQTVAATGRLSSTNPNLQNIPIRTKLGMEIRKAFIPGKGYTLLSIDYSQFELRIVASLSNDPIMIDAFKSGQDIHTRTAADINEISLDKVTSQQRREAKEINFGIIYGLGKRGLSQRAGISYDKAKEFYDRYFELHPQIRDYLDGIISKTRSLGYAETMFGRRRYFPEINSEHPMLRSTAERAATNLPIQGTQADLIKIAMVNLYHEIKKQHLESKIKMLLQVHDELVFEIKNGFEKTALTMISDIMTSVAELKVPIEVHASTGPNWAETK